MTSRLRYRLKGLLAGMFLLGSWCSDAQNAPKVYRLKNVDHANEVLAFNERFQFDQFRKGTVYLVSGGLTEAKLNYNFLFSEIQFLSPKNDTLSIDDNNLVRFVAIEKDLFYHHKNFGYVEMLKDYDGVKVCKKQGLVSIGSEKTVGYGQYVATSATDSYNSYVGAAGQLNKLEKKNTLIVTHRQSYVLVDKNDRFYPANKNGVLKIYPKFRKQIVAYMDEKPVDFNKENDLEKLIGFCSALR
jgi:hypothetical protein